MINTALFSTITGLPKYVNKDIRAGINQLYNLNYNKANQYFNKLLPAYKTHPAPWFFKAMIYWTMINNMDNTEKTDRLFLKFINISINQAKVFSSGKKNDSYYFYLAGSLGFLGRYYMYKKNWYKTITIGMKAYTLLKESISLANSNYDLYLGLGFFNFYAGKLPRALKQLAGLLGVQGDWKLGLRQLHKAGSRGQFASIEAKMILAHLYTYKIYRGHSARKILNVLTKRFPRNPGFAINLGDAQLNSGLKHLALATAQRCLGNINNGLYNKRWRFRCYAQLGKIYFTTNQYMKAMKYLNLAIKTKFQEPINYLPWVHLRRGFIFAKYGYYSIAKAEYRKTIKMNTSYKATLLAQSRLNKLQRKKN